jgi:hypothetical protein
MKGSGGAFGLWLWMGKNSGTKCTYMNNVIHSISIYYFYNILLVRHSPLKFLLFSPHCAIYVDMYERNLHHPLELGQFMYANLIANGRGNPFWDGGMFCQRSVVGWIVAQRLNRYPPQR